MLTVLLVIRFIHIVASVCWAGGAFIFFLFVEPTAKALEPAGMQFIQYMVTKRRFSVFMVVSSTLTVISGALMIRQLTGLRLLDYMSSGPGLGFTLAYCCSVSATVTGVCRHAPNRAR